MDFSKTLIRCSSLGHIMTEPRNKADKEAGNLSETAKTHLIDVFVSEKYKRNTDLQNKYIQKGLLVEEDSITLYSRIKGKFFKKNESYLSNKFIKGTPDLYIGNTIQEASHIIDIKSSWDIFTFFRNKVKGINDLYYWQMQGYMYLTGAMSASLAFCLIDTPVILVEDEKRKLMWKMGVDTSENSEFKEACNELERLMIYDDIPINERLIEFDIKRNEEDIEKIDLKVIKSREFLKDL